MQAVLVDRVSADDRFDTVTADNFESAADVAEGLIKQGHRHILLVGKTRISKAVRTRAEGFIARALALEPEVRVETLLSDADAEVQQRAVSDYLDTCSKAERPTAIFCLSQRATLMVLSELRRRAIRVPEDIALVGFDDAEWMKLTWPQITAVAQPVDAIADRAVAALLARVIGETTGFPVQYLERCDIAVRQSAGPLETPTRSSHREG
jgi:LacI family transcriptional regulator